jgi:RNA polymerase sigma-70 factor (ECF subfamily)
MDAIDRTAVLARARDGDEEAFQALVDEHSRRVFQLAFRMTGNEQDAEDVVQEGFLRAYRQLGRFESRANFGTWLYRIVANCAIDAIRARQTRMRHLTPTNLMNPENLTNPANPGNLANPANPANPMNLSTSSPNPERLAASEQTRRRIGEALDKLSPVERAAFTLRHYEGRSIDEICRTLNLNTSAAKHSVFRAVKKLRIALEPLRP